MHKEISCSNLQGISKRLFPGCDNMWWKNYFFQPAEGKQNATISPEITQPGKRLLKIPCIKTFFGHSRPKCSRVPKIPKNLRTSYKYQLLGEQGAAKRDMETGEPRAGGRRRSILGPRGHSISLFLPSRKWQTRHPRARAYPSAGMLVRL